MIECQNCHNLTRFIVEVMDSDLNPWPGEPKRWCLACVYREGNHQVYKDEPRQSIVLDSQKGFITTGGTVLE